MTEEGWSPQPSSLVFMEEGAMKKTGLVILTLVIAFTAVGCATEGYNTQRGAAVGAILGAVSGQAIGHNTAVTLIGPRVARWPGLLSATPTTRPFTTGA
jgi:hypothetical protein